MSAREPGSGAGPVTGPADRTVPPVLLVLAKAPVPGQAKTRLCPPASPEQAARIAAAALLDTLAAVRAVRGALVMVAWSGRLADAASRAEVAAALDGTVTFPQCGHTLGERIAAAHAEVARRLPGTPVLQVGMDTPQLRPRMLAAALATLAAPDGPDALLGPATDGGWWALGLRDPRHAALIEAVPTSRADTGQRSAAALRDAGLRVRTLPELSDVDTAADAVALLRSGLAGPRFTAEATSVLGATVASTFSGS